MREGINHVKRDEYTEGYKKLRAAIRYAPRNPNAWLWLGLAAAKLGNVELAEVGEC